MLTYIGFNGLMILVIYLIINSLTISRREILNLHKLFIGSYIIVLILGTISYIYANKKYKMQHDDKKHHDDNKHHGDKEDLNVIDFINKGPINKDFSKRIIKGFGMGIVFGMIDNGGLWFGMSALDPILPKGILTKAAFGNVFSDTLSAFLATFTGSIIESNFPVEGNPPIWANAGGTFMGTLIGLHLCKFITGRT